MWRGKEHQELARPAHSEEAETEDVELQGIQAKEQGRPATG